MTAPAHQYQHRQEKVRQGEMIQVVIWETRLREAEETVANATALQETRPPRRRMTVNTLRSEG